ncbi:cupin domain-containing protein [Cohnella sp. CBP 2801]|uniref:Cupin domain-containing protein n=1 Tax=Cohnella zeiphila TaxID=2761120 RepID=A0A7X0SRY1_9BACL|nr:cupin domain-containing protein [Cohnella zeiphila]
MAEWTAEGCEPGAEPVKIAPLHIHRQDDEAWYVLEGTLGFQIGDTTLEAHPNDAVLVPRGMPHTYWNPRPEPARYLIVMTSRISALIDAIHAASERNPETMKQLFARYESELPD